MGSWLVRPAILAVAVLVLIFPRLLRSSRMWGALAALTAIRIAGDWPLADNHIYLLGYWLLAIALPWADLMLQWNLAQHCQRTNLCDVEEAFGAAAGKKILVQEIDQVVASDRQRRQVAFLPIDRKQLGDVGRPSLRTFDPSAPGIMAAVEHRVFPVLERIAPNIEEPRHRSLTNGSPHAARPLPRCSRESGRGGGPDAAEGAARPA
jgi:hypothetical protein